MKHIVYKLIIFVAKDIGVQYRSSVNGVQSDYHRHSVKTGFYSVDKQENGEIL